MPVIYLAPIAYVRPKLTEEEQQDGKYSYTTVYDYTQQDKISGNGEPYDESSPGTKKGRVVTPVIGPVKRAGWYDYGEDTVLVELHPGVPAPKDWSVLDRAAFVAAATLAVEHGAWSGLEAIDLWWPSEAP